MFGQLKIRNDVSEERFDILVQRYRVDEKELAMERNESLKTRVQTKKSVRELFNTNDFTVRYFQLIQDLGYMQRGIGLKDQWAAIIAEDITKAYQIFLTIDNCQSPMDDAAVAGDMHGFFQRVCTQSRDYMTADDFKHAVCETIGLWEDGSVHSKMDMENFFKLCAVEALFDSQYFTANSIDLETLTDPHQITM